MSRGGSSRKGKTKSKHQANRQRCDMCGDRVARERLIYARNGIAVCEQCRRERRTILQLQERMWDAFHYRDMRDLQPDRAVGRVAVQQMQDNGRVRTPVQRVSSADQGRRT